MLQGKYLLMWLSLTCRSINFNFTFCSLLSTHVFFLPFSSSFSWTIVDELVFIKIINKKITGQHEGYGFIKFLSHTKAQRVMQTYNDNQMPIIDHALGVATCTQHYCCDTQQTVKWRNCPSGILLPEDAFSGNIPEYPFSGNFPEEPSSRRRICDFRKDSETPSGRTSSRMFPKEASSGRYLFTSGRKVFRKLVFLKKNVLFCNNLLLMNKLNYKMINIIIHK